MRGLDKSNLRTPTYGAEWPPGVSWPSPREQRSGSPASGWQLSFGELVAHREAVHLMSELDRQLQSGSLDDLGCRSESASAAVSALALAAAYSAHRISEGGRLHHDNPEA